MGGRATWVFVSQDVPFCWPRGVSPTSASPPRVLPAVSWWRAPSSSSRRAWGKGGPPRPCHTGVVRLRIEPSWFFLFLNLSPKTKWSYIVLFSLNSFRCTTKGRFPGPVLSVSSVHCDKVLEGFLGCAPPTRARRAQAVQVPP